MPIIDMTVALSDVEFVVELLAHSGELIGEEPADQFSIRIVIDRPETPLPSLVQAAKEGKVILQVEQEQCELSQ